MLKTGQDFREDSCCRWGDLKQYKMKKLGLVVYLLVLCVGLTDAQEASVMANVNQKQLDRFIELAKENYPQLKILELNEEKAKSVYRSQPMGYFDMFNISYYYRPNERSAITPDNPYVFNGIQYGLNINLSTLIQRPFLTKQAKVDYKITQLERQAYEHTLENEVKSRYYEYLRVLEDYKIRTQANSESKVLLQDMQLKFERGEVDLESYSTVKSGLSASLTGTLQAEVDLLMAKDALEEIIGVKLTDIEK